MNFSQEKVCPYCKGEKTTAIDSKYIVTKLLECDSCSLRFRHPQDNPDFIEKFYQSDYSIKNLMTTLPGDAELEKLKSEVFKEERSYDGYIRALFGSSVNILDYGCSWGYGIYKLINEGHNACGYELSKPRAEFGIRKVGVPIYTRQDDIPGDFDLIICSHVIEHLLDLNDFVNFCRNHLKPEGILMVFCPNGNDEYREREPENWHLGWGSLHPNYLTTGFFSHVFKNNPYLLLTDDWYYKIEDLSSWNGNNQIISDKKDGKEILAIIKPNSGTTVK